MPPVMNAPGGALRKLSRSKVPPRSTKNGSSRWPANTLVPSLNAWMAGATSEV